MEPEASAVGVVRVDGVVRFPLEGDTVSPVPSLVTAEDDITTDLRAETASAETFVTFYGAKRDVVARALALTLGDGHLGAEAADEAMARAFQRWNRVGSFVDPAGWVYRVGLNWATSVLRRRVRAPHPPIERHSTDVDAVTEPSVQVALAALGVRQRSVIVCRFYLGLSELETAYVLGIRPGTVKSRLHRGLQHLQTTLDHLRPEETR